MMDTTQLKKGNHDRDARGVVTYNNDFDVSVIKRIYFIENDDTLIIRAWQGHKIEKRWFSSVAGSFQVIVIKIDDWDNPSAELKSETYVLNSGDFQVLFVPEGYISSIHALENKAKLMVMSDYLLGELQDEYRFEQNYFEIK